MMDTLYMVAWLFCIIVLQTVNALNECENWTDWIDDENGATVDTAFAEFEYLPDLRTKYMFCETPSAIECREVEEPHRLCSEVGQIVYCDLPEGLICFHSDNKGLCKNYKIRLCCPPEKPLAVAKDEICVCDALYKVILDIPLSWHDADTYCKEAFGAQASLANLEKDDVRETVREFLQNSPDLTDPDGNGYWIGCHDEQEEGSFMWLNGDKVEVADSAWKGLNNKYNERKCDAIGHDQDCCQLWEKPKDYPKFKMDDACCTKKKSFICEVPGHCTGI